MSNFTKTQSSTTHHKSSSWIYKFIKHCQWAMSHLMIWIKSMPFAWLFLILTPQIVGMLVSWNAIDLWSIFINLLWLTVATCVLLLLQSKSIFILVSALCLFVGTSDLLHWLALEGPLTIPSIYIVLESNLEETTSFGIAHFNAYEVCLIVTYLSFACYSIWRTQWRASVNASRTVAYTYIMIFTLSIGYRTYTGHAYESYPSTLYALTLYQQQMNAYREVAKKQKAGELNIDAHSRFPHEAETVILILGESTNRNRMSLYGYKRKTSPRLEAIQSELSVFTDVVSSHSNTRASLQHALSSMEVGSKLDFNHAPTLIQIAQAAGYEVHWISNQVPIGVWDNVISVMASTAQVTHFVNLTGTSKKALGSYSYDEKVLPRVEQSLQSNSKKKLIIVHLLGAHSTYRKRYPSRFNHFKASTLLSQKDRMYASYDNALLYNDYVVAEIIERARLSEKLNSKAPVLTVYFADHGEEVYDAQAYHGHSWHKITANMVEIPFLIWSSTRWKETRAKDYARIQLSLKRPFMIDQLPHMMLDLLRIDSKELKAQHNLLSSKYSPKNRIIHEIPYEEIKLKTSELQKEYKKP